jgi:hypothetical protein
MSQREKTKAAPKRIGVISVGGAGVTSFFGAMAASASGGRADSLHVHGLDGPSNEYLDRSQSALRDRAYVQHDVLLEHVRFHVQSDELAADLEAVDFDGAEVERALRHLDDRRLDPLFDHLAWCSVLWVFLDPKQDLGPDGDARDGRLASLMILLAERRKRTAKQSAPDVAVVLTKMDEFPNVKTTQQARAFATTRQPALVAKLGRHADRIRFFPTSAHGLKAGTPSGVEEVLKWTAGSLKRRANEPKRRAAVAIVGLVLVAAASLIGMTALNRDRDQRLLADDAVSKSERLTRTANSSAHLEEPRHSLFRERLDEIAQSLGGEVGTQQVQDSLRELDRLKDARPGRSASRLEEVRRLAVRRQEEQRIAEVRDAADHQRPTLDELAKAFQRDFPTSDLQKEVEKLRSGFHDRELQTARTAVRLTVATDAATLERKAAAIREFLSSFGDRLDSAERTRMARAAELGSRFAAPGNYRIRVKRSGNLTTPRVQHVKIIVEGNPVKEFLAPEPVTTATFEKSCDVTWQAGGSVSAILVSQSRNWVNYGYYIVAERSETGLFALKALSGIGPPDVREEWRGIFNGGSAHLDLEIDGLDADDWRTVGDYLSPGDRW